MSSRENLTLELKIICATNLSHTKLMDKMDVYAAISINGVCSQTQPAKTPIDYDGGSNPTWNHLVKFSVNEREAREGHLTVNVKLYSYWLEGSVDLEVGEVNVSVQLMTLPMNATGGTKATLSLSYLFKPALANIKNPSIPDSGRLSELVVNPTELQTPTTTKLTLDLVIKRTNGIKDNSWIHGMDIYISVTVQDRTIIKNRSNTPIAFKVYKNQIWDHAIKFSLDEPLAREGRLTLFVQVINHRTIRGDIEIGEVKVPIGELLRLHPPSTLTSVMKLVTCDVIDPSGKIGTLIFEYRFFNEQATLSTAIPQTIIPLTAPPTTIPQQYIIHSYHGTTIYATVPPGEHPGTSSGLHEFYMNQQQYQSHDDKKVSLKLPK